MRALHRCLFVSFIVLSAAESDWKPLKGSPQVQVVIQSAQRDRDGFFYSPSDRPLIDERPFTLSTNSRLRLLPDGSAMPVYSSVVKQSVSSQQATSSNKNSAGIGQMAGKSSATSNSALLTKEVLLDSLKMQVGRAHRSFDNEKSQLELAKKSQSNAEIAVQHSKSHVSVLTTALSSAKIVAEMSKMSVDDAVTEMSAQTAMITDTKTKLKELEEQLQAAERDYETTKEAAEKATRSAQIAQKEVILAGIEFTNMVRSMMKVRDDIHEEDDPHQFLTDHQKKRAVTKER